jgi:hypothetical protein
MVSRIQSLFLVTVVLMVAVALALRGGPADGLDESGPLEIADRSAQPAWVVGPVPSGHTARTDRGTVVTLYHVAAPAISDADARDQAREIAFGFPAAVITAAPALHNCHGWVFTGGRYWVSQNDVPTILRDNGYREAADPLPDDVVIYHLVDGSIVHSGIVRSTGGGRVEVESKWGYMHRILHEVAAQPFARRWAYYRSDRAGNVIHFGESEAGVDTSPSE